MLRGNIRREMQNKDDTALKLTYHLTRLQGSQDRYDRIWAQECKREMEFRKLPPFNR